MFGNKKKKKKRKKVESRSSCALKYFLFFVFTLWITHLFNSQLILFASCSYRVRLFLVS